MFEATHQALSYTVAIASRRQRGNAMTVERTTGVLLIVLPVAFNVFFFLLGRMFGYPGILREPTAEILTRFEAGGTRLRLVWHGLMLTAILLAPVAILVGEVLAPDDRAIVPVATGFGVLAAAVQFLGLIRWPYLVPFLARTYNDPASTDATRESVAVVFQSFHRILGVAIGEHLGYLFTGIWTVLIGIAMTDAATFSDWLGWTGIVLGIALIIGSAEFAGPFEATGWKLAGMLVPIAYLLWSLWLIAAGVTLLI
jgi:hypothetical protein